MLSALSIRIAGRGGLLGVVMHAVVALVVVSLALAPLCLEAPECGGTCEHDTTANALHPQLVKAGSGALPATQPLTALLVASLVPSAEDAGVRPIPPGLETGRLLI